MSACLRVCLCVDMSSVYVSAFHSTSLHFSLCISSVLRYSANYQIHQHTKYTNTLHTSTHQSPPPACVNQRMRDHDQKTLFQLLCVAGATECVQLCLLRGALPDVYDSEGWSPLLVALAMNSPKVGKNQVSQSLRTIMGLRGILSPLPLPHSLLT